MVMRTHTMGRLALAAALVLIAAGCGDDGTTGDDDTTYNCEADDRDEPFTANMVRTGPGGVTFTIVEGTPVSPVRGNNTWTIDVAINGVPVTGADATLKLTPFMPDHAHGTGVKALWQPVAGTPGRYLVGPINLWMPGIWEITIEVTPVGQPRDSVLFKFCLTA